MTSCFSGQVGPITPQEIAAHRYDWQHSSILGIRAIKTGIKAAKFLKNAKANKDSAKANLTQSIAQQKQQQADIAQAKKDRNKMIAIVAGGGLVAAVIIGVLIYKLKR